MEVGRKEPRMAHEKLYKYDRAIIALIQYKSIPKAAEAVGVHPTTFWRWTIDPEFQKRLRAVQYQVFSTSIAKLREETKLASDTLLSVLRNQNASPVLKVRVAQYLLEHAERGFVMEDLNLADFPLNPDDDPATTGSGTAVGEEAPARPLISTSKTAEPEKPQELGSIQPADKPVPGKSVVKGKPGMLVATDDPVKAQPTVASNPTPGSARQPLAADNPARLPLGNWEDLIKDIPKV